MKTNVIAILLLIAVVVFTGFSEKNNDDILRSKYLRCDNLIDTAGLGMVLSGVEHERRMDVYVSDSALSQRQILSQEEPIKYQINKNGYSISIKPEWDNAVKMPRMNHKSEVDSVLYDEEFNRGIRRGNTILVTGDKPRFAIMENLKQDKLDPDLIKMGDGMIRIEIDGREEWLHLQKNISVVFNPGSTEYTCAVSSSPGLKIHLLVSQAKDWGAVIKLTCTNISDQTIQLNAGLLYGGIRKCGRTSTASYFSPIAKEDLSNNRLDTIKNATQISSDDIPDKILIYQIPSNSPVIKGGKVLYSQELIIKAAESKVIYFIVDKSIEKYSRYNKMTSQGADSLIEESKNYYESILQAYSISTPNKTLDAGFKTAVLNFDYIYADPAWLEGVHWWSSYWTNNYQISAAISLGQVAKAKKALNFFNSTEYGPAPAFMLSGKPVIDTWWATSVDGLPYYLYQLIQYYNYTGDIDLLKKIWPKLAISIRKFWKLRDPDNNGLLNWHLGANMFMYQADHLEMPGDAASPSLIMAGMMDKMSVIAKKIGADDDAKKWKSLSDKMYVNLKKILWDSKTGAFYNHRDLQNIYHSAHYYTDLVFPTLYTNLPNMIGWQSLDYLYQTLWINNYKGEKRLMRVGDFKPSFFGNDNVMPAQMSEAARAYFKEGDFDKGIKLLESVALAGTIFTEAPGNFPERMNNDGKGEANYIFGNPIGSYIYTTINGLFGLALSANGKKLDWDPSFPVNWNHASLLLPYAKIGFKKYTKDSNIYLEYKVVHDKPRELKFSLFVEPCVIKSIYCNGEKVNYSLSNGLGKMQIVFIGAKAISHEISIQYKPVKIKFTGENIFYANAKVQWKGNIDIDSLYDPQHVFKRFAIFKKSIKAVINDSSIGYHQVFAKLKNLPVIYPFYFEIKKIHCNEATYDVTTQKIFLNLTSLPPAVANKKATLNIELLTYTKSMVLWNDRYSSDTLVELPGVKILPDGVYEIQYFLMSEGMKVFENTEFIHVKGANEVSIAEMLLEREKNTIHIDISKYYNTDTIYAFAPWRNANVILDSNYFSLVSSTSKSIFNDFDLSKTRLNMAMVNYGMSDPYTCETQRSRFPESLTIPVNEKSLMVSLLFVNEIQPRLTFSKVGELVLTYKDGETQVVPLIVGKNIDALYKFFATELMPVKMDDIDYAKIYTIPGNPNKILQSFTVKLSAADIEIGIMGVNVISSKVLESKNKKQ